MVWKTVDLLAYEGTRQTLMLSNHFEIEKPGIRLPYHEHKEHKMEEKLLELLRDRKHPPIHGDQ